MNRARIASGTAIVVALAGCSHPGAPIAPPPEPMPALLNVAVTDAPDSVAAWLSDGGSYRVSERAGDTVRLESSVAGAGPALLLHRVPARDARDAIDAGVDALLTGDPEAVAYASTRPDLASLPSAWNRTYVLLVRASSTDDGRPGLSPLADTLRAGLAVGAVRVEARRAPLVAGAGADSCAALDTAAVAMDGFIVARPRIVFSRADDVARSLAARLVALGASRRGLLAALSPPLAGAGDSLRAVGVDAGDVVRAVREGGAAAAVVALPPARADACAIAGPPGAVQRIGVIALIQTRERLIARRSLTGRPLAALAQAVGDSSRVEP